MTQIAILWLVYLDKQNKKATHQIFGIYLIKQAFVISFF